MNTKLDQALDAFLNSLADRAAQTRTTYSRFLQKFVTAIGPLRPLELIRPEDIHAYITDMRNRDLKYSTHPKRPVKKEKLSSVTVYKNVKMIKTFFKWCVDTGLTEESPADRLKNPRPGRPLGQGKAATDAELELILAAVRFKPRDRAVVLLLARSGCRAGEAARLQVRDLNLEDNSALVIGKGDKQRKIWFDQETTDALRAWLKLRPAVTHGAVFTSVKSRKPLTSQSISQIIRRLCKVVGCRSLGAHSFRHRVGLKFAREHVAPRVTQAYLGHENIVITLSYYQDVDEDDLKNAGKLLS